MKQSAQKLLVIDENKSTEDLLNLIFKNDDYIIKSDSEMKGAIESLKLLPSEYDAIFINPQSEGIDYIEFKRKIKKEPTLSIIPIIQIDPPKIEASKSIEDLLKEVNEVIEFTTDEASGNLKVNAGSEISVFKKSMIDKDDPNIFHLEAPLNPTLVRALLFTLKSLLQEKRRINAFFEGKKEGIGLIENTIASFSGHEEALNLADYLALFSPNFDSTRMGLKELFFNAIEHGNLEIGYDLKGKLIKEDNFIEEVKKRSKDSKYKKRKVVVIFEKRKEGLYYQIQDEGEGFEHKRFMEPNPSRATHSHGRGIALSNKVYFDKLAYNEKGNQVTAFVSTKKRLREDFWE